MKTFLFLALLATAIVCSPFSSMSALVIYNYAGTTANRDSTITAWFQFDSAAMSDLGVGYLEIPYHSFLVTGSDAAMNGQYDRFLGGGIGFAIEVPGPLNLPIVQSLIVQNSQSTFAIMADNYGDPTIFVGGTAGTGPPTYYGQWSFESIPEPQVLQLVSLFVVYWYVASRRRFNWPIRARSKCQFSLLTQARRG
jgi:hypothetical protein